jgi:1,4-dihydroxy-2-naphthoate octaprenyltransferase
MNAPPSPRVGRAQAWVLAARPKTLLAAAAPVLVGTGLAQAHGRFAPLPALAALVGAVLIQIGTNLANDYYDWVRGGDTAERVGPVRVTQAGILPPEVVRRGMVVTLALAFLVGVYLIAVGGWPIAVVGVLSLVCAVAYTGGPFPLAYHGLGDVFVFVFFGLVAVGGTYWVQALALPADVILAGAAIGALDTAILVVNNLRDIETDARAGKRTLAVRLGRTGTRAEYCALLAMAAAAPVVGVLAYEWSPVALLSLAALVLAVPPLRRVLTAADPGDLIPALGQTARFTGLYALLLAVGVSLG